MTLQELKAVQPLDLTGALERFGGNQALYIKYLKRFPSDPSLSAFSAALKAQDSLALQESAHALKGICGNLGLTELYTAFASIVMLCRCEDTVAALEQGKALLPALTRTMTLLQDLDD